MQLKNTQDTSDAKTTQRPEEESSHARRLLLTKQRVKPFSRYVTY